MAGGERNASAPSGARCRAASSDNGRTGALCVVQAFACMPNHKNVPGGPPSGIGIDVRSDSQAVPRGREYALAKRLSRKRRGLGAFG